MFLIITNHIQTSIFLFMVIDKFILESLGAIIVNYNMSDFIFKEDDVVKYYYQILEGKIKLNNYTDNGKEILQSVVDEGQSVGEYLLFLDNVSSPVNAIAMTNCKVLKLPKNSFLTLLEQRPHFGLIFKKNISKSLHFRHIMGKSATQTSSLKLKTLFDYLKSSHSKTTPFSFQVPLTRQEMANYTGLRVETTIKTIKKMEQENLVKIVNRKIYY